MMAENVGIERLHWRSWSMPRGHAPHAVRSPLLTSQWVRFSSRDAHKDALRIRDTAVYPPTMPRCVLHTLRHQLQQCTHCHFTVAVYFL